MHQKRRLGRRESVAASRSRPTRRSSRDRRVLFPFVGKFLKFGLELAHHGRLVTARVLRDGSCFERLSPRLGLKPMACLPRDTLAHQLAQQFADRFGFLCCDFGEGRLQNRVDAERNRLHLGSSTHSLDPSVLQNVTYYVIRFVYTPPDP